MDEGKLSLDLLLGLSIFLFTFIFIANFLPGIFADVRSEINLAHQAYRISALLVEDPGYPSDWALRLADLNNCTTVEFRPGLIVLNFSESNLRKEYNHLDFKKVKIFSNLMGNDVCREEIKKYFGLNLTIFGSPYSYKFKVALKNLSGSLLTSDSAVILNHGDWETGSQVIKFERIVYLDSNNRTVDNCDLIADRCIAKLEVRLWI